MVAVLEGALAAMAVRLVVDVEVKVVMGVAEMVESMVVQLEEAGI